MASQSCRLREDLEEQPLSLSAGASIMCVFMGASVCPRKTVACVGVSGHYVQRKSSAVTQKLQWGSLGLRFLCTAGIKNPQMYVPLLMYLHSVSSYTSTVFKLRVSICCHTQ